MPNFDGGHYFLTALIPVRTDPVADPRGAGNVTSHVHALRENLARMPTALQSWAAEQIGVNSPFARDPRTHFARFVLVDDVAFNGRVHRDAIGTAIRGALGGVLGRRIPGADPTQPDRVDHLPHPYLIFVCDFDAASGEPAELDRYLHGLWSVMEPEWRAILTHCHGYGRVDGADGFARLIRACQVETTMPFNDYYEPFPKLASLNLVPLAAPALVALVALLAGLVVRLLGGGPFWLWLFVAGLVGVPLGIWFAYTRIVAAAQAPLPTGARADLPGVLKALYLQQRFTQFAIANQGRDAAALHAAFGAFLAEHKPDDTSAPTQRRGVVRS
jgi:hypothetical protein